MTSEEKNELEVQAESAPVEVPTEAEEPAETEVTPVIIEETVERPAPHVIATKEGKKDARVLILKKKRAK